MQRIFILAFQKSAVDFYVYNYEKHKSQTLIRQLQTRICFCKLLVLVYMSVELSLIVKLKCDNHFIEECRPNAGTSECRRTSQNMIL